MSRYVVMTASTSTRGRYKRIAVVETDLPNGELPRTISEDAKGVKRIVKVWEKLHVGFDTGSSSAYRRALLEANRLADKLNGVDDTDGE